MSEKKNNILRIATDLFSKHGYDKTSISMICKEANINKPSLYYHFESKEELFSEVMLSTSNYTDYFSILEKHNTNNLKKDLLNIGDEMFSFFLQHNHMTRLIYEFYIQASRNENLNNTLNYYTEDAARYLDEFLTKRHIEKHLREHTTKDEFIQLLVAALFNVELSFVMKINIDYFNVWKIIINNFLKD